MSTTTAVQSQVQAPANDKMTGAQILWASLEREGVQTVFGYPGGAILPVYDALGKSKLHHILVRHEQGATHMADGYARATGGVCVAMATPTLPLARANPSAMWVAPCSCRTNMCRMDECLSAS